MKAVELFLHFFTPRESNNHRAKALHLSSLTFYISLLLVFQIAITAVTKFNPEILGYATNINVSDLLSDTNAKRAVAGVSPLSIDGQLTAAAAGKASDMFANQYWAHVSPQGKDPWSFITGAGYNYLFAGENLARDFNDSQAVVNAWMNSPTHRDNLLNNRYQNVGFAVVNGKYGDHETTLVVQMFGTRASAPPTVEAPQEVQPATPTVPKVPALELPASPSGSPSSQATPAAKPTGEILFTKPSTNPKPPIINIASATKTISVALLVFLSTVLVIDGLLVYKRKTVRLSGHNLAHLMLLLAVLVILNLLGRGAIL